ncbi:hypothetical protein E2C01_065999 [Portunus trituberculatus]|uniref:Uncharacterized protein n=1 Tax=Portunus trituberculatus TaxID=210409 RepID=A0A5B7HNM1_PORTR|nr:hypothetical protein [Portunus trituberculatus]
MTGGGKTEEVVGKQTNPHSLKDKRLFLSRSLASGHIAFTIIDSYSKHPTSPYSGGNVLPARLKERGEGESKPAPCEGSRTHQVPAPQALSPRGLPESSGDAKSHRRDALHYPRQKAS